MADDHRGLRRLGLRRPVRGPGPGVPGGPDERPERDRHRTEPPVAAPHTGVRRERPGPAERHAPGAGPAAGPARSPPARPPAAARPRLRGRSPLLPARPPARQRAVRAGGGGPATCRRPPRPVTGVAAERPARSASRTLEDPGPSHVSGVRVAHPRDGRALMSLHGLLDAVVKDPALAEAVQAAADGNRHARRPGRPARRPPLRVAALAREPAAPVLAVTATGREAEDLAAALRSLLPPDGVVGVPVLGDAAARAALAALATPSAAASPCCAASPTRAPTTRTTGPVSRRRRARPLRAPAAGQGPRRPGARRRCAPGRAPTSARSSTALAAAAYSRVELVEKRGEFAVRGGILDVFPPTEEHPLRVEFWGDDVEEIRYFKVADQRSLEVAEHGLWAPPCRELLLTDEVRRAGRRARRGPPRAGRTARQDRRGHRRGGHGVPGPGPRRRHGAAARRAARRARWRWSATRSGSAPGPPTWSRPPGVPAGVLGGHRGRRRGPDRPGRGLPVVASRTSATGPASWA